MDLSQVMDGMAEKEKEVPTILECSGFVASQFFNGEAKIAVTEDEVKLTSSLNIASIHYSEIDEISFVDYVVHIKTENDRIAISKLGYDGEPFYNKTLDAYNEKVRKALFISGEILFKAKGNYKIDEFGSEISGQAPFYVYENCVLILPPDKNARRIPLCFVENVSNFDYETTIVLVTGETYKFSKMGYDFTGFSKCIETQLIKMREKALGEVRSICTTVSGTQAAELSKLLPEGVAAPITGVMSISPDFIKSLDEIIKTTKIAESYQVLLEIGDASRTCVGFKNSFALTNDNSLMIWLNVPSKTKGVCAVEFASEEGDAAATFIYKYDGDFSQFASRLNRAMEAISFKREIIRLTEEELKENKNMQYKMAINRNVALSFVRSCFCGRIIHSSEDHWKKEIEDYFN